MNGFQLTAEVLESTYQNAIAQGIRVKALLITNPENPTGVQYDRSLLLDCVDFVNRYNLHLIVNEMYFMSQHEGDQHESIFTFPEEELPSADRLHVVWGFSKSFAMSGFRIGCVITKSRALKDSFMSINYFTGVGGLTQHQIGSVICCAYW